MRAIVFSDTHGDIKLVEDAIKHFKSPEYRFGLGDYEVDPFILEALGVTGVKGNSFFDPEWGYNFTYNVGNFRLLFTHGHKMGVRDGLYRLHLYSKENKIDIAFYGHTHIAAIEEHENIYYINPGSTTRPYSPAFPTLVYMEINQNIAEIKIVDAITYEVYKEIKIVK